MYLGCRLGERKKEAVMGKSGYGSHGGNCGGGKDKNDMLILHFRDINHVMHALYEGRGSQKGILITLLEVGAVTQRELTRRLGIQPGSVSEVLAKLEKNGLILRTENPQDRRTTDITLTDQGRLLAQEAAGRRKKRHEEMFSCLTEEEKDALLVLLGKVNEDWRQRYREIECHPEKGHGSGVKDHPEGRHYRAGESR